MRLAGGVGGRKLVGKEQSFPHKLPALPLSLGSLEHEFGGLYIGVFGHGSGDTSV